MEKRMIIAVVLSVLVLGAFQLLSPKKTVQPLAPPQSLTEQAMPETQSLGGQESLTGRNVATKAVSTSPGERETTETIETDLYEMVFSSRGGTLKTLILKEFSSDTGGEVLFDAQTDNERLFSTTSPMLKGLETATFKARKGAQGIEYVYVQDGWLEVTKKYTTHNSLYYIDLELSAKNLSSRTVDFTYQITGAADIQSATKVAGRNFLEAATLIDDKLWKAKSVKGLQERAGNIAWTAMKNRYFAGILTPLQPVRSATIFALSGKKIKTTLTSMQTEIGPGQTIRQQYVFYAGPQNEQDLKALGYGMDRIIDYGFFGAVSKVLLKILRFFYGIAHNWGIAIILLTIVINILLFPLTMKSFSSMHQMKTIQPHIQQLKDLHKDNPQKLNKETMELYKKYNVNPLGGCLPMILQMPIFISLYQGLMKSVELKGAHFLWIKDLSRPDAVHLPFTLPFLGNTINVLPLLMVGVMALQQRITQAATPATGDQASQQKMMMIMFPLLFGFLFYKMPSGLVLYWLTNTILMTTDQTLMHKRMTAE